MKANSFLNFKAVRCMAVIIVMAMGEPISSAQSLSEAVESSRNRVEEAKKQLAELRAKIEAETLPLSKKLSQMEIDVAGRRAQSQDVDRTLSTKHLENTNLQSAVKLKNEENAYLASILDEFVRGFETRLFSGEAPRYKPIVEEAKLAMGNQDLGSSDKFARQIAAVKAATARLQEIVGGARYPGRAVDLKGNLMSGTFAIIGPAAFFASEFGDVTGLAIQQATSPNPLIRPIPLEGEMGEPHEKFLHWVSGFFSKGAHEGRAGVKELVAGTEGWMALDPSRGAALAGLVAPMTSRYFFTALLPSSTCTTMGPDTMNFTRSLKNGRLA